MSEALSLDELKRKLFCPRLTIREGEVYYIASGEEVGVRSLVIEAGGVLYNAGHLIITDYFPG